MGELHTYREIMTGGTSRGILRQDVESGRTVRVTRGVYTQGSPVELERWRALLMRLPDGVMLGYESAARIHGFGVLRSDDLHLERPSRAFPAWWRTSRSSRSPSR